MNTAKNSRKRNNPNKRPKRKLKRTTKNKIQRQYNRLNRLKMPAAYTKSFSKFFRIVKQDGNSMTVRGRDLVYSIPDNLVATYQDSNVITVIPCNPCYWLGTRVAAIANGYQNYRPLKFNVNYVPQCAVTQQGNVISGTIWNQTPSSANLQQTLRTSSGGMLTQCYKTATSVVTMKSNLQFNLYRCAGKFDQESNPFIFLSIAVGCLDANGNKIIPGYFYVSWEFTFKNPIGYCTEFLNSGIKPIKEMTLKNSNVTLVACQSVAETKIETGMVIQVDTVNDELVFTYNNSELALTKDSNLICWSFQNRALGKAEVYDEIETEIIYTSTVLVPSSGKITLPGRCSAVWLGPDGLLYTVFNLTATSQDPDLSSTEVVTAMPQGSTIYIQAENTRKEHDAGRFVEIIYTSDYAVQAFFQYTPEENESIIFTNENNIQDNINFEKKKKAILKA